MYAASYDEAKHPRDEHGRWTDTGGGALAIETREPIAHPEDTVAVGRLAVVVNEDGKGIAQMGATHPALYADMEHEPGHPWVRVGLMPPDGDYAPYVTVVHSTPSDPRMASIVIEVLDRYHPSPVQLEWISPYGALQTRDFESWQEAKLWLQSKRPREPKPITEEEARKKWAAEADFDETKHPRDKTGKFAETGEHANTEQAAPVYVPEGFEPPERDADGHSVGIGFVTGDGRVPYVSSNTSHDELVHEALHEDPTATGGIRIYREESGEVAINFLPNGVTSEAFRALEWWLDVYTHEGDAYWIDTSRGLGPSVNIKTTSKDRALRLVLKHGRGRTDVNAAEWEEDKHPRDEHGQWIEVSEGEAPPPAVVTAFTALAHAQRDAPEHAMLRVQEAYGGGVLNGVVEHVGDLSHRMAEMVQYPQAYAGWEFVKEKVDKTLRWLTQRYGFAREMEENIQSNAKFAGEPAAERQAKVDAALRAYAEAHAALPVYNRPQWLARTAAVAVGRKQWNDATVTLFALQELVDRGKEAWRREATAYRLDADGRPRPYQAGDRRRLQAAEWDESQHPRDEQGKFTEAIDSPTFKTWFGDSKVVDDAGQPLRVYHGTIAGDITEFRPNYRAHEQLGFGIHFAESAELASRYATPGQAARQKAIVPLARGKAPAVLPVYLSAQRPLIADQIVKEGSPEFALAKALAGSRLMTQTDEDGKKIAYLQNAIDATSGKRAEKLIRAAGYDAVRYTAQVIEHAAPGAYRSIQSGTSWIVFEPTQIKSAIGNRGTFDPKNPDISAAEWDEDKHPRDEQGKWTESGGKLWDFGDQSLRDVLDNATEPAEIAAALDHFGARKVTFEGSDRAPVWVHDQHVITWDGEDTYPSVTRAEDWIADADLSDEIGRAEDQFHEDFWSSPPPLYHATTEEHAEDIDREGLEARDETRGLANRSTGAAVFTTSEADEAAAGADAGDVVYVIDTAAMKRDGLTPRVAQEEPEVEAELRDSLAHELGFEDYYADRESGISPFTVVLFGDIPAKYLRRAERSELRGAAEWDEDQHPRDAQGRFSETEGEQSAPTDTPAFKAWFKDSKVVDEAGQPLVVYHGTRKPFKVFDPTRLGESTSAENTAIGFFFTDDFNVANDLYANKPGTVLECYLSLQHPLHLTDDLGVLIDPGDALDTEARNYLEHKPESVADWQAYRDYVKLQGYDGIVYEGGGITTFIAFEPTQIKSAIGNRGTFDPNDPDISAATEPTPAQAEAGNYPKRHVTVHGLDVSIETEAGQMRHSTTLKDGKPVWSQRMRHAYGYVRGTVGKDGDHVDVFLSTRPASSVHAFIINQATPDGTFDEHKVMLGWPTQESAVKAYLANYPPGQEHRILSVRSMGVRTLKTWLEHGDTTLAASAAVLDALPAGARVGPWLKHAGVWMQGARLLASDALAAEWEEDKHPRDERGRFAGGGAEPIGVGPEDKPRSAPAVDWYARDLQDSEAVTAESIRRVYGAPGDAVYRAWVPIEDLPSPVLAEETEGALGDEEPAGYDWSEYSPRATFPPVKLEVAADGTIAIVDGNHRLHYWEEVGHHYAPAWVIDKRGAVRARVEAATEFDESKHPRDEHGRWTDAGGTEHTLEITTLPARATGDNDIAVVVDEHGRGVEQYRGNHLEMLKRLDISTDRAEPPWLRVVLQPPERRGQGIVSVSVQSGPLVAMAPLAVAVLEHYQPKADLISIEWPSPPPRDLPREKVFDTWQQAVGWLRQRFIIEPVEPISEEEARKKWAAEADFDESKHPRDEHGRFAETEGGESPEARGQRTASAVAAPIQRFYQPGGAERFVAETRASLAEVWGREGQATFDRYLEEERTLLHELPLGHGTTIEGAIAAWTEGLKPKADLPEAQGHTGEADVADGLDRFVFAYHGKRGGGFGDVDLYLDNRALDDPGAFSTPKDIAFSMEPDDTKGHPNPREGFPLATKERYGAAMVRGLDEHCTALAARRARNRLTEQNSRHGIDPSQLGTFEVKLPRQPPSRILGFMVYGHGPERQALLDAGIPEHMIWSAPSIIDNPGTTQEENGRAIIAHQRELQRQANTRALRAEFDESQHPRDAHGRFSETGGEGAKGAGISPPDTPAFKAWFADSTVVDEDHKPLVVYHGTNADPTEFKPYTHFGTLGAANERAKQLEDFSTEVVHRDPGAFQVMPVYLAITNPLRMPDLASLDSQTGKPLDEALNESGGNTDDVYPRGWESDEAVATTLLEMGIIDIDEFEDARSNDKAFRLLADKGYDGIVYENVVEDPGTDSWIIFRPEQVKSALGNKGTFDSKNPTITAASLDAIVLGSQLGEWTRTPTGWQCGDRHVASELLAAEWDETKHPRDERGKFTESGGDAPAQTTTPAFQAWFGNSQVVDAKGQPLRVYHATAADFAVFDPAHAESLGMHFGTVEQANKVAESRRGPILPVYLQIEHPLRLPRDLVFTDPTEVIPELRKVGALTRADERSLKPLFDVVEETGGNSPSNDDSTYVAACKAVMRATEKLLQAHGYDGLIYPNAFEGGGLSYAVFRPEQIKSAIGNKGTFDSKNPDITAAEFDESKHPRDDHGQFTETETERGAHEAQVRLSTLTGHDWTVTVSEDPLAIRAAHTLADVLTEMRAQGYRMPRMITVDRRPGGVVRGNTTLGRLVGVPPWVTISLPSELPVDADLDAAVAAAFGERVTAPDGTVVDRFAVRTFRDVIVHEMCHAQQPRSSGLGVSLSEKERHAAWSVSKYATTDVAEFKAECFVRLMRGETLSPDAQAAYTALRGPRVRRRARSEAP